MASQLDFAGGTFVDGLVADADDSPRVAEAAAVESHRRLVIAFVGLDFEARIAAAPACRWSAAPPARSWTRSPTRPSAKAIAV